jgi:hypothetical protein
MSHKMLTKINRKTSALRDNVAQKVNVDLVNHAGKKCKSGRDFSKRRTKGVDDLIITQWGSFCEDFVVKPTECHPRGERVSANTNDGGLEKTAAMPLTSPDPRCASALRRAAGMTKNMILPLCHSEAMAEESLAQDF